MILLGVLFFNKIFVFEGFRIKYAGGEEEEKTLKHYQKNSSDEELTQNDHDDACIALPKLQLDDEDEMAGSTTSSREATGATLRNTTLSTIQENPLTAEQEREKMTDI